MGSIILNHKAGSHAYEKADWHGFRIWDIFVIHAFAVHPLYLGSSTGKRLMEFALGTKKPGGKIKAIRLDVYEKAHQPSPLQKSHGFYYIDTVDLGYGEFGPG